MVPHVHTLTALAAGPFRIRDERPGDAVARERLLDAAFGPDRRARTCERLREGRRPAEHLALVAEDTDRRVIGTLRLWHVEIGSAGPGLMLGPIAVAIEARSLGLGAGLIDTAIERARRLGHRAIVLVGDAPYYRRFGFRADPTGDLDLPGPVERHRFLALELAPAALAEAHGMVAATGRSLLAARAA